MYHSTIYLCTHPLPIYLCIRPSIHPSRHRPNNPFLCVYLIYLLIHPSTPMYLFCFACLSFYPYLSVPPPPPMHLMISIGSVTDCSERSKLAVATLVT